MKKVILLGSFLCGFSILCFAKGTLELSGGMPLNWDKGTADGHEAEVQMTSLSFGAGYVNPMNERFSLGVWMEAIVPLKLDGTIDGERVKLGRSDYKSLFGMSALFGTEINIYSSADGNLKFPLTVGVRYMWLITETDYTNIFGTQVGLGLGIGAKYHLTERFYFLGQAMGYYDFYAMTSTTTTTRNGTASTTGSGLINSFGFTPKVGVGIVF